MPTITFLSTSPIFFLKGFLKGIELGWFLNWLSLIYFKNRWKCFPPFPQYHKGLAMDTPRSVSMDKQRMWSWMLAMGWSPNLPERQARNEGFNKRIWEWRRWVAWGKGRRVFTLYFCFPEGVLNLPLLWLIMSSSSSTTHPSVSLHLTAAHCADGLGVFPHITAKGLLFTMLKILFIWQIFPLFILPANIQCAICQH